MSRVFTCIKEIPTCGYACPAYRCDDLECGGGDYRYCKKYKKEIYGNIIKDGFPTFCELMEV